MKILRAGQDVRCPALAQDNHDGEKEMGSWKPGSGPSSDDFLCISGQVLDFF